MSEFPDRQKKGLPCGRPFSLFDVFVTFLSVTLASQCFFGALLFAGLQVEGVTFDLFDDVLLLDLALESPQGAFQGFTLL